MNDFEKWFEEHQKLPNYGDLSWFETAQAAYEAGQSASAARIAELEAVCAATEQQLTKWRNKFNRAIESGCVTIADEQERIAELVCQKTALQHVVADREADLEFAYKRASVLADICKIPVHESPEVTGTILGLVRGHVERLQADCKAMAEGLIKSHKVANCGNNKAMDYIRHGAIIKACPACIIAAKYRGEE